ncbi:MAG: serpin family protein [Lachnospiraceae bacterium]|nr:serpin family protein [Lachnospiraceae bacterium]
MKYSSPLKKITSLLCVFALLLSLMACGAESAGTENGSAEAGASQSGLPIAPGKVQAADLLENFTAQPVEEKETDEAFAGALLRLGTLLLQKLGEEQSGSNLLVSPLSVMTALTMTANGAAGETLAEMERVLGGSLKLADLNAYQAAWYRNLAKASDSVTLRFANAIWFKDEPGFIVKDSFLQTNVDHFSAAIRKAPFDDATLRDINQWADLNTDHMIPEILDFLSPNDVMVLLNALCLEAKWSVPFDENEVRKEALFVTEDHTLRKVSLMQASENAYLEDDLCTGFRKDYAGGYSFVALLPRQTDSLGDFVRALNEKRLLNLLGSQQDVPVFIGLPKFSYDFKADLADSLAALGMPGAFALADFSGITDSYLLSIDRVIHKTHIDVDSEGTRAAAVTAVTMRKNAAPVYPDQKEVVLDRPFVYLILDQDNVPIFMGTVLDIAP